VKSGTLTLRICSTYFLAGFWIRGVVLDKITSPVSLAAHDLELSAVKVPSSAILSRTEWLGSIVLFIFFFLVGGAVDLSTALIFATVP
jgi:hypothetical protein